MEADVRARLVTPRSPSKQSKAASPIAARIEVASHTVADLDRRLSQIDTTIEEAAKRGKTNAALSAVEGQKKARAALVD